MLYMLQCEKLFWVSFLRYLKKMCSFDFWTVSRYCCKQFRTGPNSKNLVLPDSSFSRWASDMFLLSIMFFLHTTRTKKMQTYFVLVFHWPGSNPITTSPCLVKTVCLLCQAEYWVQGITQTWTNWFGFSNRFDSPNLESNCVESAWVGTWVRIEPESNFYGGN